MVGKPRNHPVVRNGRPPVPKPSFQCERRRRYSLQKLRSFAIRRHLGRHRRTLRRHVGSERCASDLARPDHHRLFVRICNLLFRPYRDNSTLFGNCGVRIKAHSTSNTCQRWVESRMAAKVSWVESGRCHHARQPYHVAMDTTLPTIAGLGGDADASIERELRILNLKRALLLSELRTRKIQSQLPDFLTRALLDLFDPLFRPLQGGWGQLGPGPARMRP